MRDGGDILINRDLFPSPQSAALTAPLEHKGSLTGDEGRGARSPSVFACGESTSLPEGGIQGTKDERCRYSPAAIDIFA